MSIDVAIPGDRNVTKKEAEKVFNQKDLITELQHMWNVKAKVRTETTGASGTISQSLRQYLSDIPGMHEIKALQSTAVLSTAHTLREVLM